jgi:hypothetical protein
MEMQILITSRFEQPHALLEWLKGELPRHLAVNDLMIKEVWIPLTTDGNTQLEELRAVIAFAVRDDDFGIALQVLTSVFEGMGTEFYCPDTNICWTVG